MKISNSKTLKYLKLFWLILATPVVTLLIILGCVSLGWFGYMPTLEELDNPKSSLATEVYSADGKLLGSFSIENRKNTEYSELPPYLVNALVAREDHRFYSHSGIDMLGLTRVLFKTLILGKKTEGGGSTLSQQLVKTLFPRDMEEFNSSCFHMAITKFKEWIIAIRLERKYTKEEIITMYLNSVAFSNDVYGIKTASEVYFNKAPHQLKIEEATLLVGMLKGISLYNPNRNPERAFNRRNSVLRKMYEHQYIAKFQYDSLKVLPVRLNYKPQTYKSGLATYMREYLRYIMTRNKPDRNNFASGDAYKEAVCQWDENPLYGWCYKNHKPDGSPFNIYRDGLKIYTTIDSRMQQCAEDALTSHLSKILQPGFFKSKKGKNNAPFASYFPNNFVLERLQLAMKQTDRYRSLKNIGYTEKEIEKNFHEKTEMQVFTWKGLKDTLLSPWDSIRYAKYYLRSSFMAVDPINGYIKAYVGGPDIRYFKYDGVMKQKRQVGSTIKPFIYAAGLENGFKPCDQILNSPVTFTLPNGKFYIPQNDETTVFDNQMVTLTWGLAHSVNNVVAGLFQQIQYKPVIDLLRRAGIRSDIPEVPSIFLGTPEFTMSELVGAYTIFPGKGIYSQPIMVTRIEDKHGNLISAYVPQKREVMNPQIAYAMTQMLREVVNIGTGRRIQTSYGLYNEIGGKTGTTQNQSDGWFVGITPNLVAAAWVGGDEPSIHFDYMSEGQGASMALPIYAMFLKKVYEDTTIDMGIRKFEKPEGIDQLYDCPSDTNNTKENNYFMEKEMK